MKCTTTLKKWKIRVVKAQQNDIMYPAMYLASTVAISSIILFSAIYLIYPFSCIT